MILALDLSTVGTGVSIYTDEGELFDYRVIKPSDKLHNFEKIKYIVDNLKLDLHNANHLVIEDIFLNTFIGNKGQIQHNVTGYCILAKLCGAVTNEWLQEHTEIPTLYKAVEARKLVGVKGSCQKAEVQLWVIKNFEKVQKQVKDSIDVDDWEAIIDSEYASLMAKEMVKSTFKNHMDNISKTIEEITGIDENIADSILLGMSYVTTIRIKKDSNNNK